MSKKIYVGNMNYSTTEQDLEELFSQYGSVLNVNIVTDRMTNQSKGFAFVEMEDAEAANTAISEINNKEFKGRNLKVNEAKERKPGKSNYRY
ncbi:MAG: RNA-binding protein [Spirochaetales bacterium]|nr:RNA-binding protein [Spirochaetales bacterium]